MSPIVELLKGHPRLALRVAAAYAVPVVPMVAPLAGRLIALGSIDLAERLLKRGLERSPNSPELLEQHALCAHNNGRYLEALARWDRLRDARPDLPMAWCGIACNARELGRIDEAAAAIAEALARSPDDLIVISEAARIRDAQKAYAEAADLWARTLEHPCPPAKWRLALVRDLLILRRYDEVERALDGMPPAREQTFGGPRRRAALIWSEMTVELATEREALLFPSLREIEKRFGDAAFAVAKVAETTKNLPGAREALRRMLEDAPADLAARECYVRVLTRSDLLLDAEREIETGLRIAPRHEYLHALRGLIAMRRLNWASAEAAWMAYAEKNPHDRTVVPFIDRLRWVRELQAPVEPEAVARPGPIAPKLCDDPEIRRLMLSFESIGATCEFGAIQRRYGAEPLGLLRWAGTEVPTLMAAVAASFAGMGDPETTELTVGPSDEIYIRDTRWHMPMHTFLNASEVSLEALLPKMRRRTAYLRDKLLSDVREGQKTLVFKTDNVERAELLALHDAFCRLGPVRLLHVRLALGTGGFPNARPGTAIQLRPGLFVGWVSRTSLSEPPHQEWIDICRAVERLGGTPSKDPVDVDPPMACV